MWGFKTLAVGVELGLFTRLAGGRTMTVEQAAAEFGCPTGLRTCCWPPVRRSGCWRRPATVTATPSWRSSSWSRVARTTSARRCATPTCAPTCPGTASARPCAPIGR
ncbi:hypothetical protein NKG94_12390 [Micromonospora sp. M12]